MLLKAQNLHTSPMNGCQSGAPRHTNINAGIELKILVHPIGQAHVEPTGPVILIFLRTDEGEKLHVARQASTMS